jgi:hypothetical protein
MKAGFLNSGATARAKPIKAASKPEEQTLGASANLSEVLFLCLSSHLIACTATCAEVHDRGAICRDQLL